MTITKNAVFQWIKGATVTAKVTGVDGTLIQSGIACTETSAGVSGVFLAPITAAVASSLTTYFFEGYVSGSGKQLFDRGVDLKETAGNYLVSELPTALMNASSSSSGSGANSVTITVQDNGSVAIQSATVTVFSGSTIVATGSTNASGVVVLSLNNGTYTVNITAGTFNGSGGNSLTVSGATSHTYQLSPLSITPSSSPEVTGYLTCVDENGNAAAAVVHLFTLIGSQDSATGMSTSNRQWSVQSDTNGLVQTSFLQGFNYYIKRGPTGTQKKFTAPSNNTTFQLPDCIG